MGNQLKHVSIIMDGNGRWAKSLGLPRLEGHRQGAEALTKIVECAASMAIPYLTVYAFSTENWNRPDDEIQGLMFLLKFYLRQKIKEIHRNNIRFVMIGERKRLSPQILASIEDAEKLTQYNTGMTFVVALSYGSRQELVTAVQELVVTGCKASDITEESFSQHLYTKDFPDVDLMIRTSGEQRISNFLLWQSAYAEFYFTPTFWPDFSPEEFSKAVEFFSTRERRYGLLSEQVVDNPL